MMLIELATPATANTVTSAAPSGNDDDPVQPGNGGAADDRVEQPHRQQRRQRRGQQAARGTDLLGQVFGQAGDQRRHAAGQQQQRLLPRRRVEPPQHQGAGHGTGQDADAADARHRQGMELLRAGQVVVVRQVGMRLGRAHRDQRHDERHRECHDQDQHAANSIGRAGAARMRAFGRWTGDRLASTSYHRAPPGFAQRPPRMHFTRAQLPHFCLSTFPMRSWLRTGLLCLALAGCRRGAGPERQ